MTTAPAPAVEEFPDYYSILGLTRAASEADVKKSYRKLAMKWHPDKNGNNGDETALKFQEIAEAYDVLTDKEKRAIYDQFGYEGLRDGVVDNYGVTRSGYGKPDAQEVFQNFFGTKNPFADFGFNDAKPFGSKLKKPGPKKSDPVVQDLPLTLEELFNGCTKRLAITRKKFTPEGQLVDSTKVLTINIKPGWKKGTKVTFPCEGDEGPNIIPADVIFTITEKPHSHFVREGSNLVFTAKILLVDAITDCFIEVPTLDGRKLSLPCPEVVSPGYEKLIHGEGMPLSKQPNNRGDLVIRFNIIFPKYINEEKKAKLRNLLAHPEKS